MAEIAITGLDQVTAKLNRLVGEFPSLVERAVYEELSVEALESQRRTPVDTGALRASHRVTTDSKPGEVTGTITVGGPSAPYAVPVHENLNAFHPVGQAKFLESTVDEARPFLSARIAKRVDVTRAAR